MTRAPMLLSLVLLAFGASDTLAFQVCPTRDLTLQVLGSGGPFARDDRASAGYLLWIGDRAAVMIDAGGGTFQRFGASGARIEDLRFLGVSHLHPDHSADLPALFWVGNVFREETLPVAGPSGDDVFPSMDRFLAGLFGESGVFPVLSGVVGGDGLGFRVEPTVVDVRASTVSTVFVAEDLRVLAHAVPHNAPSVAYRVEAAGRSVVFGGDQNGSDPAFADFARGADVLVMHLAVAESRGGPVHASPGRVGEIAAEAAPGTLVLSHLMGVDRQHPRYADFSLADLERNVGIVRERFSGKVEVAEDLECIPLVGG